MTGPVTPVAIAEAVRAGAMTLQESADLIQHYAEQYAVGEVIKALQEQNQRTIAILEGPLRRMAS